jgi:uncharacterized DUF497 family protein
VHIESVICSESIEEKLERKHGVMLREVRQVFLNHPRIRFAEEGHTPGENVYAAFGQTFGGRYLSVFFIYKSAMKTAVILSARDISTKERKSYGRKSEDRYIKG